jgi:hypothetical protein
MEIEFLSTMAMIAPDPPISRKLYVDALGLPLELLHPERQEPWGQTVVRLQSPEGAIVGVSYTPLLRDGQDDPA